MRPFASPRAPAGRAPVGVAAAALTVALGGGCFNFNPPAEDAGVGVGSGFAGEVSLLGPQAASAGVGSFQLERAKVTRALFEARGQEQAEAAPSSSIDPVARKGTLLTPPPSARPAPLREPDWAPGELVVLLEKGRFSPRQVSERVTQHLQGLGHDVVAKHASCVERLFCHLDLEDREGKRLDKAQTRVIETALNASRFDGLKNAAGNYLYQGMRLPDDTYYTLQRWHYEFARLPAAWDMTTGDPSVRVAIVDTGLNLGHPDIQGRVGTGIDMISEESIAGDNDGRDIDPTDPGVQTGFHGTHVAGTVGAASDNALGCAGVTWVGEIIPVRVLGNGTAGQSFDIVSGVFWAAGATNFEDENGNLTVPFLNQTPAKVINMSLGAPYNEADYNNWVGYVDDLTGANASAYGYPILVVAAGNENQAADNVTPANVASVITVGAHRYDGRRSEYSNYGNLIDVMAPGGQTSLDQNGDGYPDGVLSLQANEYNYEQGTSMASPHVTGIVALMAAAKLQSGDPNPLTQAEAQTILLNTANAAGVCAEGCGTGWVDAAAAVQAAGGVIADNPSLSVDISVLLFPTGVDVLDVAIRNFGNGTAEYNISVVGPQASAFQVTPTSGTIPSSGTASLRVQVIRGNLAAGFANLQIDGVGATAGQQRFVDLVFNDVAIPPKFQINTVEIGAYQVRPDGNYRLVGDTALARRDGNFQWQITGLDPGEYYIFAVGDDNADGVFDAQTESFGAWPVANSPEAIVLEPNTLATGVRFGLSGGFILDGAGSVGSPCINDDQCTWAVDAACIVPGAGWTNGYCSRLCDDGYCGAGASCEGLLCGEGQPCNVCLVTCTSPTQCRGGEGYVCDSYQTCSPEGFSP